MSRIHIEMLLAYYQTTVIFIDDDSDFLDDIVQMSESAEFNANFKSFTDAQNALEYIDAQSNDAVSSMLEVEAFKSDNRNLGLINKIKSLKDIKSKINDVSLVVVDYFMPAMDGITFSQKLRKINPDIKILMLTGEADESIAVNAFNDGVIDQFVKKESLPFSKIVLGAALKQIKNYFQARSRNIIDSLGGGGNRGLPDCVFSTVSAGMMEVAFPFENLQALYLLDARGTFYVKDNMGEKYCSLLSDPDMNNLIEMSLEYAKDVDQTDMVSLIIDKIKAKKEVPVFTSQADYQLTLEDWQNLLAPLNHVEIEGESYYLAIS